MRINFFVTTSIIWSCSFLTFASDYPSSSYLAPEESGTHNWGEQVGSKRARRGDSEAEQDGPWNKQARVEHESAQSDGAVEKPTKIAWPFVCQGLTRCPIETAGSIFLYMADSKEDGILIGSFAPYFPKHKIPISVLGTTTTSKENTEAKKTLSKVAAKQPRDSFAAHPTNRADGADVDEDDDSQYSFCPFSMPWNICYALATLQEKGRGYLEDVAHFIHHHTISAGKLLAFHAESVACIRKWKTGKDNEFGRVFQLGRIGGNFIVAYTSQSVRMDDKTSLVPAINEHAALY